MGNRREGLRHLKAKGGGTTELLLPAVAPIAVLVMTDVNVRAAVVALVLMNRTVAALWDVNCACVWAARGLITRGEADTEQGESNEFHYVSFSRV